ncbi:MAG TPA: Pvc16 family protein [Pyrinomonadaceae bacterium]|jgi:hypothetical protein|nr:Pvc16 family protein [Pyrinomonadaceae bacterium]
MALADTSKAIGAVSALLKARIDAISTITTSIGRPSGGANSNPHLNLFLYEITFDPYLKNTSLNEGEKPPLWLVLKYLLTAFESAADSDSERAHEHLGVALRALYADDLLRLEPALSASILDALGPNPSPLHITFDEAPSDLVAKLMQGPDEKIRLSASFQVRPVMIASSAPGDFSLPVGVDHTKPPVSPKVGIDVISSMGARIEELKPGGFEVGEEVTILGTDLHLSGLSVMLGPVELPVTLQRPDELRFRTDPSIIAASTISAGSHPVTVVQTLPGTGKKRKSNAVVGNLVPTISNAEIIDDEVTITGSKASAIVELTGLLLGSDSDDAMLAFYRNGAVSNMFDTLAASPDPAPRQTKIRLVMPAPPPPPDPGNLAVERGDYNIILLVNGQQAPQSPVIHLDKP